MTGDLPLVRDLPADDWHRLATLEPFATGGLPNPAFNRILVAEVGGPGGEVVGYWMVLTCVHAEPIWIKDEHRKRPGLIRRLWGAVWQVLQENDVQIAFACITDKDAASNVPLAMRLGFEKVPGDLYYIRVPPRASEKE